MIGRRHMVGVCICVGILTSCGGVARGPLTSPDTTGAGVSSTVGRVTIFTIQAVNQSNRELVLSGIEILRVPGEPSPLLEHYAVIPSNDSLEDAKGWPPPAVGGPGPHGTWPVVPFQGYVVGPHKFVSIVVGVVGTRVGTVYVMGGVKVQYRVGSSGYSSVLGMVDLICLNTAGQAVHDPCQSPHDEAVVRRAATYVTGLGSG